MHKDDLHDGQEPQAAAPHTPMEQPAPEQEQEQPQELARLQDELASMKDKALRALAEADNIRKRSEREKQDIGKYAITGFARDLLTVMDTLERALSAIPEQGDAPWTTFAEGVRMTASELQKTFAKHGLTQVNPQGQPFDHNLHQAMMEIDSADVAPGHVAQVLQPGYVLHDRLVRPAMVSVVRSSGAQANA